VSTAAPSAGASTSSTTLANHLPGRSWRVRHLSWRLEPSQAGLLPCPRARCRRVGPDRKPYRVVDLEAATNSVPAGRYWSTPKASSLSGHRSPEIRRPQSPALPPDHRRNPGGPASVGTGADRRVAALIMELVGVSALPFAVGRTCPCRRRRASLWVEWCAGWWTASARPTPLPTAPGPATTTSPRHAHGVGPHRRRSHHRCAPVCGRDPARGEKDPRSGRLVPPGRIETGGPWCPFWPWLLLCCSSAHAESAREHNAARLVLVKRTRCASGTSASGGLGAQRPFVVWAPATAVARPVYCLCSPR